MNQFSSNSANFWSCNIRRNDYTQHLSNFEFSAGVIDEDYRGNIGVVVFNHSDEPFEVKAGDRIAQLICQRISYPVLKEVQVMDSLLFIQFITFLIIIIIWAKRIQESRGSLTQNWGKLWGGVLILKKSADVRIKIVQRLQHLEYIQQTLLHWMVI